MFVNIYLWWNKRPETEYKSIMWPSTHVEFIWLFFSKEGSTVIVLIYILVQVSYIFVATDESTVQGPDSLCSTAPE